MLTNVNMQTFTGAFTVLAGLLVVMWLFMLPVIKSADKKQEKKWLEREKRVAERRKWRL